MVAFFWPVNADAPLKPDTATPRQRPIAYASPERLAYFLRRVASTKRGWS